MLNPGSKLLFMVLALTLMMAPAPSSAAEWEPVSEFEIKYPLFIPGVYKQGSDVTEPKKTKGAFVQVQEGGVLLESGGAKLFVRVRASELPAGELYLRAEFSNPTGGAAFVTELDLKRDGTYMLTSPNVIRGLKGKDDYLITVNVFDRKDKSRPVDTVIQKVRCYVDTRGGEVMIYSGVLAEGAQAK